MTRAHRGTERAAHAPSGGHWPRDPTGPGQPRRAGGQSRAPRGQRLLSRSREITTRAAAADPDPPTLSHSPRNFPRALNISRRARCNSVQTTYRLAAAAKRSRAAGRCPPARELSRAERAQPRARRSTRHSGGAKGERGDARRRRSSSSLAPRMHAKPVHRARD